MIGEKDCPETSVRNYPTRYLITQKGAVLIYFGAGLKSRMVSD